MFGLCRAEWNSIIEVYKKCKRALHEATGGEYLAQAIIDMLEDEWGCKYIAGYLGED